MSELTYDAAGALLLGGEVVAVPYADATVARIAQCVSGAVLEGGLGLGQTRLALSSSDGVSSVQTVEINADVVSAFSDQQTSDLASGAASIGGRSAPVSDANAITTGDVRDVVAAAVGGEAPWSSGFFDVPPEVVMDATFQTNLAAVFNWYGARAVVLTEDNSVTLTGFSLVHSEATTDGRYMLVFDRFDPDNGVGERGGFSHYEPGRGWVPLEDVR